MQNLDGQGFQYYSPAICPEGFNVGPNCIISTQTKAGEGFPAMAPGETAAWCVPNGMTCTGDTTDFRGGFWGFAAAATTSNAPVVYGPVLQIRWVDADLSRLETHPLTPGLVLAGATAASTPPATSASGFATIPTSTPAAPPTAPPTGVASSTTSPRSISTDTNTQGTQTGSSSSSNDIDPQGSPTASDATAPAAPTQTNGQAPSSSGAPGGGFMSDARTSTAIIALLSILIATLLGFLAFVLLRRRGHGRRAVFEFSTVASVGSLIRLRVNRGRTYRYSDSMQSSKRAAHLSTPSLDAESGLLEAAGFGFGRAAAPMAEVGPNPARGTHLNPAELEAAEAARPSRWSWKSRMSGKLAWLSRPSTPSRSTPTPSASSQAMLPRSSSHRTATTSCTVDRKSWDEKQLPGVPNPGLRPVPAVAPGTTAKIIRMQGSRALQDDVPPPLPEKNALGIQLPRTSAWNRQSGGSDRSARTFGARPPPCAHADAMIPPDDVVGGSTRDEDRSSSPRPEPPDK